MGRVAAPFGVKGWVKIAPFTERRPRSRGTAAGGSARQGEWREVAVEEAAVHGASVVARLAGCDDRDAAARLRGARSRCRARRCPRRRRTSSTGPTWSAWTW